MAKRSIPNFYCSINTQMTLIQLKYPKNHKYTDVTMDMTDSPFWVYYSENEKKRTVKVVTRSNFMVRDTNTMDELISLTVDKATDKVIMGNTYTEGVQGLLEGMMTTCRNLSCYAQENKLDIEFADLDADEYGYMLSADGEKISHKLVSGKDRPDMLCQVLGGNLEMCRPYWDEHFNNLTPFGETLKAAEEGDVDAIGKVADDYIHGYNIESNPEKAAYWTAKLANANDSIGQSNLALFYAKGYGVERDFEKAAYWAKKAAENGDSDGTIGGKIFEKAAEMIKKINESDDADAQAELADIFLKIAPWGEGLNDAEDDYALAFEYATKSANQGSPSGNFILGRCYQFGYGVKIDEKRAVEEFKKGVDKGHAGATSCLAYSYFHGVGVKKDKEKAFEYGLKAAKLGSSPAMKLVGILYQFGDGVEEDMKSAIKWYKKYLELNDDPELALKVSLWEDIEF